MSGLRCLIALCAAALVPAAHAAGDDFIIVIEDEGAPSDGESAATTQSAATTDAAAVIDDAAPTSQPDALIVIEGETPRPGGDSASPGAPAVARAPWVLPLRADFVGVSGLVLARGGLWYATETAGDPWRGVAEGRFGIDLRPRNPWRAHLDAFVRGTGRAALPALDWKPDAAVEVGADTVASRSALEIGEAYVSLGVPKGSIAFGRQVFAWSRTELARLADVVNPADARSGLLFPEGDGGKLPVLAVAGRLLLGRIAVQGVWTPLFEPPRAQYFASESEAQSLIQQPLALAPSPAALGSDGLGRVYRDAREAMAGPRTEVGTSEVALRATGTAGGIDLGAQVFYGYDRTPALELPPGMARALGLANDGVLLPGAVDEIARLCPRPNEAGGCTPLRELGRLEYLRTLSGQVDAATMIGPTVIKAELMAVPKGEPLPGSVVHVVEQNTRALASITLSKLAAAAALETGYGEWIEGSFEVIDVAYLNVPPGLRVARVEPAGTAVGFERTVHRLVLGASVHGALFDRDLRWRCAALVSPVQRDYALAPRLVYRTLFDQDLALGAEIVGGPAGSLGSFFAAASRVYAEWRIEF
ncbi:MAG: hypothetical protein JXR83_04000 [Deltaproteobacteria bacterium]|nr:hypothetical protein [Deltaproteobacteria bacterium]